MAIEFLDPTHEDIASNFSLAPKLETLEGSVVALISNGKRGTIPFFNTFERLLCEQHRVAEVVRITKSNYSTPVDAQFLDDANRWHALVAGIGD